MAPEDLKTKKRKGATDASPKPKKQKKADDATMIKKASAKALSAVSQPLDELSVHSKPSRKRAIDFWEDDAPAKDKKGKKNKVAVDANGEEGKTEALVKQKKAKKAKVVEEDVAADTTVNDTKAKSKKAKKVKQTEEDEDAPSKKDKESKVIVEEDVPAVSDTKKTKKKSTKKQEEATNTLSDESEDSEEDEDDQTAALLAGFESDRDESDLEKEDGEGIDLDAVKGIPDEARLELAKVKKGSSKEEPGVVFIGRIPHGFYEPQMKAYFKQFGVVTRLRLSRNKKTGASKHYAFVEFASDEVAEIVAKTMNNYLMFSHVLQCKFIPAEQVHPDLFEGAKGRYKRMPRNKMVGAQMARGAERDVWAKRVEKETKRRSRRTKALKDQFDYEFTAPSVKSVDVVPKKTPAVTDAATEQLLLEAAPGEITVVESEAHPNGLTVTETVTVKKSKKGAKAKGEPAADVSEITEVLETTTEEKPKKSKKSKSKIEAAPETSVEEEVGIANKKPKKGAKSEVDADSVTPEKKRKGKAVDAEGAKPKKAKNSKA